MKLLLENWRGYIKEASGASFEDIQKEYEKYFDPRPSRPTTWAKKKYLKLFHPVARTGRVKLEKMTLAKENPLSSLLGRRVKIEGIPEEDKTLTTGNTNYPWVATDMTTYRGELYAKDLPIDLEGQEGTIKDIMFDHGRNQPTYLTWIRFEWDEPWLQKSKVHRVLLSDLARSKKWIKLK